MDIAMLVITGLATFAAIASAVVAVVQARGAKDSRAAAAEARDEAQQAERETVELSRKATAAFERQAGAQEQANRLREAELRPPEWTGPRHVSGDLYRVVNTSERTLVVQEWEIDPEAAESLIAIYAAGHTFEYGQSFDFMYSNRMGLSIRRVTIVYRFDNELESPPRRFMLVL